MLAFLAVGCAPKREAISVYHETSTIAAKISADLEARDKGGIPYVIMPTGSMEPTIRGGDYVVSIPTLFADLKVGMIVVYTPEWNGQKVTVHRLVGVWPDGGFIAEGDGPKNTAETQSRVDTSNYLGHVISAHRFP